MTTFTTQYLTRVAHVVTCFFLVSWQLHDWVQVNKKALVDVLKEQDEAKSEVITTEQFFSTLEGIAAPLDSDIKVKLLAIYDKKGEGKINYTDFLTEQKFVHAVRLVFVCVENTVCFTILVCMTTLAWCLCLQSYKLGPKDDIKAKAKKGKKGKKGGGKKGKVNQPSVYKKYLF